MIEHTKVPEHVKMDVDQNFKAFKAEFAAHVYPFLTAQPISPTQTMAVIALATELIVGGWVTLYESFDPTAPGGQETIAQLRVFVTESLTSVMKVVIATDPAKVANQIGSFKVVDGPAPDA